MRATIVIVAAALAISGCGQDEAVENTTNIDEAAAVEGISSNDTTAIDAATGEDAEMAADVNFVLEDENSDDEAAESDSRPDRTSPRRVIRDAPAKPARDTGNSTENTQ